MINADISPYFSDLLPELEKARTCTGSLFVKDADDAIAGLEAPYTNADDLIEFMQRAQRIVTIFKAGLIGNDAFRTEYDSYNLPTWKSHPPLPADIGKQESLGKRLFNVPDNRKDAHVLVSVGPGSNHIARPLIEVLKDKHIPFIISAPDESFTRLIYNHMSNDAMQPYVDYYLARHDKITHRSSASPNAVQKSPVPENRERSKQFAKMTESFGKRGLTGQIMFTLTAFPTPVDAEIDGIPYQQYLDLYFEMCDQPDAWIEKANEHLIAKLEATSTLRFTNQWGTDVSMSLIDTDGRHFTFANSQTKKNIPGSEVFSAPRRDSINGVIVSKGKFLPKAGKNNLIVDLTLNFKDGKVVSFDAAQGRENFQEYLDRAPNNAYVGELGIGTNPHLKRHVANGLLVEKVSSSFHLALGEAYQITNYLGKEVHMNNGNDSLDHWDITTMLGDMYLDGVAVMKDGKFLDPELDVLNRGWDAVPVEQRPAQWKNYKGPFTA